MAKNKAKEKKLSPFSEKELRQLQKALLEEKQRTLRQGNFTREVMDIPSNTGELSFHRTHIADQGSENFQCEFASQLKSIEFHALREIDEALTRIAQGTYGICERCGEPIPYARLEVVPYARLCMKCSKPQKAKR